MHGNEFRAALARAPSLCADALNAAAQRAGGIEALAALSGAQLGTLCLAADTIRALLAPDAKTLEADLAVIDCYALRLIASCDSEYPALLRRISAAPPLLFVRGNPAVLELPQLAMVGSRNPSANGAATARDFAAYFARSGLAITSGLALGVDAAAHHGALDGGGATIAVCGTGLDTVYPRQNAALVERILAGGGALVSEFPPGTRADKWHFPRRNRLISGLSLGTLVVEAARDSGSLITARYAADQSREVFAIPGSIHSPLSRGCHQLIRDGAKLVEAAADVLSELNISLSDQRVNSADSGSPPGLSPSRPIDKEYEILLDAVGFEPTSIDAVVERTGFQAESVASMLLILELEGRVAPQPGGRFSRPV